MRTCISLLRGINVGGNNKIKMQELAEAYRALGFENVRWYIQSGNLVFNAPDDVGTGDTERNIEDRIHEQFGLTVPVMVIDAGDFKRMVTGSPFADDSPEKSVMVFTDGTEAAAKWAESAAAKMVEGEQCVVQGNVVYVYLPFGIGISVAAGALTARPPKGVKATMRNWRTVNKIVELANEA